ncbi:hypothetical protein RNJ44_01798 [Nakaseomyces bracarensis]|uniref:Cell wall mannoprotein PIR1-like C-terminal domain-containing protein n=1 Tax=Nakaseomyces bracarensis TaxID=273131 RepID=A0ABR4NNU1_9SACH
MQFKKISLLAGLAAAASASDASATTTASTTTKTFTPGDNFSTFAPNATYSGAAVNFTSTFGIAVQSIDKASVYSKSLVSTSSTSTLSPSTSTSSVAPSSSASPNITIVNSSCKNDGTLVMDLENGILRDGMGRIGSIVSNRQFQFDGPPPQAGAIYAAGWSITPEGNLALGDSDVFYQCSSGNFYNLYDEYIAEQCHPIHLEVLSLVECADE